MASVNKVILVGNLGRDPEVRFLPDGTAAATLSVATSERWRDKQTGEMREQTEWHRVVFFGRAAEVVGEYLKNGAPVYVEGSIRTRKWTDKNGQERYTTEIRGDVMKMIGPRGDQSEQQAAPAAPQRANGGAAQGVDVGAGFAPDEDIPF